jgi:murein DD-endopeptidase MepM/ murein hydrolase activator NlpD
MRIQILELLSGNVSRAALLAATAALAGCSSDTGRFEDPVYTGSTPNQRAILSNGGDAYAGNAYAPSQGYGRAGDRQWQNVDTTGSIDPGTAPVARADLTPPPAGAYTETVARPLPDGNRTAGMTQVAANGGWTPIGGTYVTMRQGETLDTLSGRYGVPVAALRQANNLQPGRTANPGDRVVIPVYNQPTAAAPTAPAAPVVHSQPVRTVAVQPVRTAPAPVAPPPSRLTTGSVPAPAPVAAAPRAPAPASVPVAPKVAATQPAPQPGGVKLVGAYTVKHGDTLASIARTYGVSEQSLRERNNLKTASLTPGQQILLPAGTKLMLKTSQAPAAATQPPAAAKPAVPTTVAKVDPAKAAVPAKPVQTAAFKPTIATGKEAAKIDQKAAETIAVAREPTVAEDEKAGGTFRWPVRGRIISEYGAKANGEKNEGINLAVPEGTSVKAADGGEVIYSGNELKGYGNLVLVRHDNGFVSAYAHASELLVNRGDKVTRGQIIARAGATGSVSQPQLHFELRKGQKAVDPKPYLASN